MPLWLLLLGAIFAFSSDPDGNPAGAFVWDTEQAIYGMVIHTPPRMA